MRSSCARVLVPLLRLLGNGPALSLATVTQASLPQRLPPDPLEEGNRIMFTKSLFGSLTRSSIAGAFVALAGLFSGTSAEAQSLHSLRAATEEYRDAARNFESHVRSDRRFSHYDRRVADRLEDASSDFRSAARNPRDVERLLHYWNEVSAAHFLAERLVRGCGRPDPALLECWHPVAEAYQCLVAEMRCLSGHGGHSSYRIPVDPQPSPWHHGGVNHGGMHHGGLNQGGFPSQAFPGGEIPHDGGFRGVDEYRVPRDPRLDPGWAEPGFGRNLRTPSPVPSRPWQNDGLGSVQGYRQPAVEVRPVDPRREVGAAIAVSILNRLLSQ